MMLIAFRLRGYPIYGIDVYKSQEFKDTFQRIAKNTNRFEYGETPDAESLAQTEALLAFCARAGIEVTAFLPPYAPVSYTHLDVYKRQRAACSRSYICCKAVPA